jgi:quercetin dioxygenase-like cupin family protein
VPGCPGEVHKELWRDGDFVHALIRFKAGSGISGPAHLAAHHHMWVLSGTAALAGRRVAAGSYAHIPPGVEHPVADAGPDGCVLLQLHLPHG